jgi:hypothetical protein
MKLLLCPDCTDVFNLTSRLKSCRCGKARGVYVNDVDAVYSDGVPLGFANSSFLKAVIEPPKIGRGKEFTAFVIPAQCPTFMHMPDHRLLQE